LTAWYRPGRAVFPNTAVAEFVRAFPDRFIGIAGVDLQDPVAAVREVQRWCGDGVEVEGMLVRLKGVRVVPWLWGLPPADRH